MWNSMLDDFWCWLLVYQHFSKRWNFEHFIVSAGNHKANGKAEFAVKSAKSLMKNKKDTYTDLFLALLNFWKVVLLDDY